MRLFFLVALLALPFVAFAALALLRKARYRALAATLGAEHLATGLLAPGTIAGRDFRIEAAQVGKTYRTCVQVAAGDTPGHYWLEPEFFRFAPDWAFARVPARRNERVFLWQVTLPGQAQPSPEQQVELLRWLPRASELADLHAALEAAGIGTILIADGTVSTRFRGILSNAARIRGTLEALRRLAPASPGESAAPLRRELRA